MPVIRLQKMQCYNLKLYLQVVNFMLKSEKKQAVTQQVFAY